jgi:hypothetical protein
VTVCAGIFPVPLAVYPLVFALPAADQAKVAPLTGDAGETKVVCPPLHIVWGGMALTVGIG